ncbi:hypothetical protein ACROYT_G017934 [Oculina patagonica]
MDRPLPDEDIETAEAHRSTHAHFKKAKEFYHYKELYLQKVHPCLRKEDELRKTLEDPSLSGKRTQVALDLERLERIHSSIKSEVQTIESSLDWTNISSLISELKSFELALEETEKIVEQEKQDSFTAENEERESEDEQMHEDNKEEEGEEGNEPLKEMPGEKKKGGKSKRRRQKRKK